MGVVLECRRSSQPVLGVFLMALKVLIVTEDGEVLDTIKVIEELPIVAATETPRHALMKLARDIVDLIGRNYECEE
jgi:hypothetical protein